MKQQSPAEYCSTTATLSTVKPFHYKQQPHANAFFLSLFLKALQPAHPPRAMTTYDRQNTITYCNDASLSSIHLICCQNVKLCCPASLALIYVSGLTRVVPFSHPHTFTHTHSYTHTHSLSPGLWLTRT